MHRTSSAASWPRLVAELTQQLSHFEAANREAAAEIVRRSTELAGLRSRLEARDIQLDELERRVEQLSGLLDVVPLAGAGR